MMLLGLLAGCAAFVGAEMDRDNSAIRELKAAAPAQTDVVNPPRPAGQPIPISSPDAVTTWNALKQISLSTHRALEFSRKESDGRIIEEHNVFYQPDEETFYLFSITDFRGRKRFAILTSQTGERPSWGNRSYFGPGVQRDEVSFSEDCENERPDTASGSIRGFQSKCRRDPELAEILKGETKFWADWLALSRDAQRPVAP